MKTQLSPFILNKLELWVASSVIIFTWLGLYINFVNYLPSVQEPAQNYIINELNKWVLILVSILALSSIFLVRGIQNRNVVGFSRLSHFAFAWPLILFPTVTFLWFFSYPCFPFGLILPLLSMIESLESKKWLGSISAMIWIIGCTILASYYINVIDELVGW